MVVVDLTNPFAPAVAPDETAAAISGFTLRRYLGPLKVYFLCAGIFFIVGPRVSGFSLERQLAHDPDGTRHARIERRIAETSRGAPGTAGSSGSSPPKSSVRYQSS